jgi:chromosome partitioning protein
MKELTQYGVEDLQVLLNAFGELGESILSGEITDEITPANVKELRNFKIKEACQMVGRSDTYLKNLEKTNPEFAPQKDNGIRSYDLALINRIRDKTGTRLKRPETADTMIIAFSNFKGGVAKSNKTKSFADYLGLKGLRVLVVGLDPQGTDALYFGMIPELELKPSDTIMNAVLKAPKMIRAAIKKTYFPGIDIIPGNLSLTEVEISLNNYKEQMALIKQLGFPDERLQKALDEIKDDYDVILIDCGPNLNILTLNAINAANGLIIPVPPALPDLASFCTYCSTLSKHLESDKSKVLEVFRILVTKHPKNRTAEKISNIMVKEFGSYVLPKFVVHSAEIELAASKLCSVYELPPSSKKTYLRAKESLDAAFNEILEAILTVWQRQDSDRNNETGIKGEELENVY